MKLEFVAAAVALLGPCAMAAQAQRPRSDTADVLGAVAPLVHASDAVQRVTVSCLTAARHDRPCPVSQTPRRESLFLVFLQGDSARVDLSSSAANAGFPTVTYVILKRRAGVWSVTSKKSYDRLSGRPGILLRPPTGA